MQKWTSGAQLRFQHPRHAPQYYQAQGEAVSSSVCLFAGLATTCFHRVVLKYLAWRAGTDFRVFVFQNCVIFKTGVGYLQSVVFTEPLWNEFTPHPIFPHRYVVVSSKKIWHLPFISFVTVWPFSGWQNVISRADTVLVIVEGVRNMCFSRCGQIQLVSAHFGFQPFWWLARPLRQCHIDTTATEASSKSASRRTGVYRRARANLQRELPNVAKEASKKISMVCLLCFPSFRKNGN